MKHLIISLIFTSSVFAAPPSFALIESKEDAKRIAIDVENFLIKIQQSIDFYVGGVYNEHSIDGDIDKRNGHPIIALGYKNYTLEYAHPQWFIATNDRYWKLKMRKFLGRDKMYLEIQQKKDRYMVKGFVKLF